MRDESTNKQWRIVASLFAFLCAFCCVAAPSRASSAFLSEQGSALVSIDAVSQDAKAAIAQLATSAGVNIVIDDSIGSRVTVHLADVPFDHALETIARAAGAEVAVERDMYIVTNSRSYYGPPQAAVEQTVSQILDVSNMDFSSVLTLVQAVAKNLEIEPFPELGAVMLRGPYSQVNAAKAVLDGYLRAFSPYGQTDVQGFRLVRLAYADASEASMSLQGQFQSVRIVPVRGENAVVVSGPARHADQAAAAIKELDHAPALLSFDAEILEVNSDDMGSLGVDWQNSQGQPMLTLTLREIDPPISPGTPPASDVFSARPWIRTSL